jgi:hypothetical protein
MDHSAMDSDCNELHRFIESARTFDGSLDRFWALQGPLQDLVSSGFFSRWVNDRLGEMRNRPDDPGLWFWPQFDVYRSDELDLSVQVVDEPPPLRTSVGAALYVPIRRALRCQLYEVPPHRNDVFDPSIQLIPTSAPSVGEGEALRTPPDVIVDLQPADACAPVAVAALVLPIARTFRWMFDRTSLQAIRATDASTATVQMRAAAEVLGHFKDPASIGVLVEQTRSPHHTVRWAALQNIARIDAAVALPLLEHALADPTPQIHAAASRTLQQHGRKTGE